MSPFPALFRLSPFPALFRPFSGPTLGDDADGFAQDVRAGRAELPAEANPWD
jgi:hypothetical protein